MLNFITNRFCILITILCSQAVPGVTAAQEISSNSVTFGVVPQQSAAKVAAKWVPLARYIEKATGIKVKFHTAKDIPTFEQRLIDGEYDLSYMNPYHYIVFKDRIGYSAIAKARDKKLKGILVVRKESTIDSLDDLEAKKLAFPSPAAFAASMLTRAELQNRGINFTPKYVSSHDSVYRTVAAGLYSAGGGVMRTFNSVDESIRNQLEILWESSGSTPHAIAHHPRVDKKVVEAITSALIELESSDSAGSILKNLNIKGFVHATDSDWNDVRALNIDSPVGLDN